MSPSIRVTPVTRGLIFVVIAAVAWGTGGVVAAILYRGTGLGPIAVSFWRTLIGAVLLGLLSARSGFSFGRATFRPMVTLATGVGLAVYQTAYYAAVAASGVALATLLTLGSAPVLIALGARWFLGERLGLLGTTAIGLAPVGLLLMVGFSSPDSANSAASAASAGSTAVGVGLSLVSAGGYALVTVLHRALGGVDPARTTLSGFVVAGVCLAPLAYLEGLWPVRGEALPTIALLGYLGVFSTAVAYRLFFASLGTVRATTVSVLTLTEPLTAAALAVVFLGERLTWPMAAGATILLTTVILLARSETGRSKIPLRDADYPIPCNAHR